MKRVKDPMTNRENGRDAPEWVDGAATTNKEQAELRTFKTKLQAFQ